MTPKVNEEPELKPWTYSYNGISWPIHCDSKLIGIEVNESSAKSIIASHNAALESQRKKFDSVPTSGPFDDDEERIIEEAWGRLPEEERLEMCRDSFNIGFRTASLSKRQPQEKDLRPAEAMPPRGLSPK